MSRLAEVVRQLDETIELVTPSELAYLIRKNVKQPKRDDLRGLPTTATKSDDDDALERLATNWSLIDAVNADASLHWTAGPGTGAFADATLGDYARLCGTLPEDPPQHQAQAPPPTPAQDATTIATLPDAFDWRNQSIAAKCPSISRVRDQAGCGSCWAFGTAEAMTDRQCIASKGAVSVELSSQDIASCACAVPPPCTKPPCTCPKNPGPACPCGGGCNGGQLGQAWDYYEKVGVVDGGLFGDNTTCDPYTLASCAHHTVDPKKKNCSDDVALTPDPTACGGKQCVNGKDYTSSKHFGLSKSSKAVNGETAMMQELMAHGPLSCSFIVMDFFTAYHSGIMHGGSVSSPNGECAGHMLGFHAIEVVGWGVDLSNASNPPLKYWVVKNSWSEDCECSNTNAPCLFCMPPSRCSVRLHVTQRYDFCRG